MAAFPREAAAYKKATKALVDAINKQLPIGTQVIAKWGQGWLYGVIIHAAKETDPERIAVRSQLGRVHWKHYSDVLKEE
jgi:hypothetical protein